MAHLDEKLIPERLAARKQSHRNIYDEEVYAGPDILHFVPTSIFDGKARVMLPDTFEDMPDLMAEVKYPSSQRPKVIKTSEDGSVNFCFNLFKSPIEQKSIESVAINFQSTLQRTQPSLVLVGHKTNHLLDTDISWFDFYSFSIDEQMYNLLFVTSIGGKLMNGAMNCPRILERDWSPIMHQVVLSIEDLAKEKIEGA